MFEWVSRVNWVDVVLVIIMLRSAYVGSQRGILGELFYIIAIWISIICGMHFYLIGSNFLNTYLFIPLNISGLISYALITIGIYLIFKLVHAILPEQKIIKVQIMPVVNAIIGPMLGLFKGFAIAIIFIMIILLIPVSYVIDSAKTRSLFSPYIIKGGTALYYKSLSLVPKVQPKDLTSLTEGAKPLDLERFRLKRKDRLDEVLQ